MGKSAVKGENSKKASGNAKKAEAAAGKAAAENAKKASAEDTEWSKGAKSNKKAEEASTKKAELARKKAEKDALLAAEEASAPKGPSKTKSAATKKTAGAGARGLDLAQLDAGAGPSTLNASGIDNALDALALTSGSDANAKVDRHPERRFKAAYAAFEARRLPEVETELPGLRRQQRIDIVRKEFERSEENPFNQVTVGFDASGDEVREARERERKKVEDRLGTD